MRIFDFVPSVIKRNTTATNSNERTSGRPPEMRTAGSPVTRGCEEWILIPKEGGGFEFDEKKLRDILKKNNALDKPMVVVSVAGAFRTGKSFLLNFFLRYMRNNGTKNWMGDADPHLEGFSWRGGCERNTGGILVWSEVFLVTGPKGEEVAVLLMDTQGTFDTETSFKDVVAVFALSTLTSSVQVYNLQNNIKEDDLQHLQYFIEYGKLAQKQQSHKKPFQKLVFLVRDWSFVTSYPFGAEGGKDLISHRLRASKKHEEQKILRELLQSCFTEIDCFLLPYPGSQVANGETPVGELPPMEETFRHHLQDFVTSVLAPDKLRAKRIFGQKISGKHWVTFFSNYAKMITKGCLPEPKTALEIAAESQNLMAQTDAKKAYKEGMEKECGKDQPFHNLSHMLCLHEAHLKVALDVFNRAPKMGGETVSRKYLEELKKDLEEMRKEFFENNKKKGCKGTAVALSVPMAISIAGAVGAGIVGGPIGIAAAATGALIGGFSFSSLIAWGFSLATGKVMAVRATVDNAVDYHWRKMFKRKKTTAEVASLTQEDSHSPADDSDEEREFVETARPVQILRTNNDHSLELNEEALRRILLADDVKDKPVVVISVAGAFGTGKSFLLDFFLRYMSTEGKGDWIGDRSSTFRGSNWHEACKNNTSGIVLWEKVFLVTRSDGEKVAVLLMYTHGAFDTLSTIEDCTNVIALSCMTSSIQVYNISKTITEGDLEHLQFLKEYGRLVQQNNSERPFQELLFLVRDWTDQKNSRYGEEAGRGFLQSRLKISQQKNNEREHLRRLIWSCFAEVRCFLMPHPGRKVVAEPSFHGPLSDVGNNFTKQMHELASSLLHPDKLLVKEISGKKITCQELMTHFQVYVNAFNRPDLAQSNCEPQVMDQLNILVARATADYASRMEKLCGEDEPYLSPALLESHHWRERDSALKWFFSRLKMPGEAVSRRCLDGLTQAIDKTFEKFVVLNETKMTLVTVRTPATLCATLLALYLLSCASTLLGLQGFASFCRLLMGVPFISLGLWSYVRLSGIMTDVATLIDNIAAAICSSVGMSWALNKTTKWRTLFKSTGQGREACRNYRTREN